MNVSEAVQARRTIRAFLAEPVPEAIIREVLELARYAPSNSNTQPWRIDVVSGDARTRLQSAIFEEINAGVKPYPAFPPGGSGLKGRYKERQRECAYTYFAAVGIDKDDRKARAELSLKNYEFFGAPHAAFLSYPETMHRANALDVGIFCRRSCCCSSSGVSPRARRALWQPTRAPSRRCSPSRKATPSCAGCPSAIRTRRRKSTPRGKDGSGAARDVRQLHPLARMHRLHYQAHGNPAHEAIALLHGFMSCNAQWLSNIEALSTRHRVVAIELWGHGRSPTPTNPQCYTLDAYYRQLEAIRNELGIDRWSVIGQSYGAGIMLNYANTHTDACRAVVATNSRSAFGDTSADGSKSSRTRPLPADLRKLPYHPIHSRRFPTPSRTRWFAVPMPCIKKPFGWEAF